MVSAPVKLIDLPDEPETIAFRSLERMLRSDPGLAPHVATWRTRTGEADQMTVPSMGQCPILAMSLDPVPEADFTVDTSWVPVRILIELVVRGSCQDDIANLWGAVVRAFRFGKPYLGGDLYAYLRCHLLPGVNVADLRVVRPAFSAWLPSDAIPGAALAVPPGMMLGRGSVEFAYPRER